MVACTTMKLRSIPVQSSGHQLATTEAATTYSRQEVEVEELPISAKNSFMVYETHLSQCTA